MAGVHLNFVKSIMTKTSNHKEMNTDMKVAIIGLGNIGKAVASNLIRGNQAVTVASRELTNAQQFAASVGDLATAREIRDAIAESDIIIPAIYFHKIQEFLKDYASELQGKVIVDVSNPIAPDGNGGFTKIIGADESAGEILSALVPAGAVLVKAFGTLGAGSLISDAFAAEQKVLFYAGGDASAQAKIAKLISASGFAPVYAGDLGQSIRLEVFGELHEFGALGKTVTLAEATAALHQHA